MKQILFIILFANMVVSTSNAQKVVMEKMDDKSVMADSTKTACQNCYCNLISVGGRFYVNPLGNTRTTLAANGFTLDEAATEIQVRLYNLPKIFYFQQLGTLTNTNYVSVTGFGVKEDLRWNIFKNSNFILAPYVEIGGGYYRMNIAKGINSNSFASVLKGNVENYFVDNFVVSGDIGLDLGFGFNVENKRFSLIFTGGYTTNFPAEWRLASSLAFKEKINLASPYAGVSLRMDMNCNSCRSNNSMMCK